MFNFFKFQNYRSYWKIRNLVLLSKFWIHRLFFQGNLKIKDAQEELSIVTHLTWLASKTILFSILIVVSCESFEKAILKFLPTNTTILLAGMHDLVIRNSSSLENFIMTIASILGVFLGLYFTAISIVASSVFTAVPSNVRELYLKEKIGNTYIRILAILLAISIIIFGCRIFGYYPSTLLTVLMLIFSCVSIFAFVMLGVRAFSFFDPTVLVDIIFADLYADIRLASVSGLRWLDSNFQSHYHKLASKNVNTLANLVEICLKNPHLYKKSVPLLSWRLCYFLKDYQMQKARIPTDSYWFSRIPKYKDTFIVDDTTLTVALQTQTSIQPESITDNYWLEDEIFEILTNMLSIMLNNHNIIISADILDGINKYFEDLGEKLEGKKCCDMFKKIEAVMEPYFLSLSEEKCKGIADVNFALFDRYNMLLLSCAMGFNKFIREFKTSSFMQNIDSILWEDRGAIYRNSMVPMLLERLEFLQKRLEFEQKVEGEFVSPTWYRRQLLSNKIGLIVNEVFESMMSSLQNFYVNSSSALLNKKAVILTTYRAKRGLEVFWKMQTHILHLKKLIENLEKFNIEKELFWPKWDWDVIEKKIDKNNDALIQQEAKCLPALSIINKTENEPDLFGETYHKICEECFASLANNKDEKFSTIFHSLFIGALQAHDRLRISYKDRDARTQILISFQPLADLIEVSGYAKIYSELFSSPKLWETCQECWNNYLNNKEKKDETIEYIITSYQYKKAQFGLFARDIWKTNWQIKLNRKLQEMNLIDSMFREDDYPRKPKERLADKSPFIRTLCRGRYEPFIRASEIFLLIYFVKQLGVKNFSDNHNFIRHLEEEEAKTNVTK
ncbi:MAG TPA: hypothetical protein PL155_07760 [Candidatus Omnitrophota bacterium]|nr:hypothetical protein [Candidatus Omnitrophota bacterium]HPD85270.1 hypothetical protein [Candidatus Omnitrophota bacterium]HRZ04229.1 hypothetical protein [Candidatus Omnitrophota bacterium]